MTAALEGGEWSAARPGRNLPPGKIRYPLYRRLRGPQGRSGQAENLVPTGIQSRTVQPVVSRYTDVSSVLRLIQDDCEGMWNDTDGENRCSRRDTLLGTTCPPQTPYRLSWDRIGSSTVRDRRVTAWAKKICSCLHGAECFLRRW